MQFSNWELHSSLWHKPKTKDGWHYHRYKETENSQNVIGSFHFNPEWSLRIQVQGVEGSSSLAASQTEKTKGRVPNYTGWHQTPR